jgi:hypothetical protein
MATKVYTNSQFLVNSVDLSSYLQELNVNYQAEMLDETAMGDLTRARIGGLKVWSFAAKMNDDFALAGPSNTIWNLVGCQTCVEWRPVNACSTAINPYYWGIAAVDGCPMGGSVGTLAQESITFQSAGVLTRTTACQGA